MYKMYLGSLSKRVSRAVTGFFTVNIDLLLKAIEFLMKTTKISAKHTSSLRNSQELLDGINEVKMEILKLDIYPKIVVAFMVAISAPVMILWKMAVDMSTDFFHFAGTCLMPIRTGILFFPLALLRPGFEKTPTIQPIPLEPTAVDEGSQNSGGGAAKGSCFISEKPVVETTPLQIALKLHAIQQSSAAETHHATSKLIKHSANIQLAPKQEITNNMGAK